MKELMKIANAMPEKITGIKVDSAEIEKRAETLPSDTLRKVYLQGKGFERLVRGVMTGVRPVLLQRAKETGEKVNGHSKLSVDGGVIEAQQRISKEIDVDKVKEILEPKGLWEKVLKFYIDKDALKGLLATGEITDNEYRAMEIVKPPVFALIVR